MNLVRTLFITILGVVFLVSVRAHTVDPAVIDPADRPSAAFSDNPFSKSAVRSDPNLEAGALKVSLRDGMTQVYIPAGAFMMGSDQGDADERPAREVTLDAFWIDRTEVSNASYTLCVAAGVCDPPRDPTFFEDSAYRDHPIVGITWEDAQAYCGWAGRRLPSEAEWEKAARGPDGGSFPWGDGIDCSRANYWDCPQFETTSPVGYYGAKGASPYGVYDMVGNVWEWTADWYDADYYQDAPASNPTGPASGIYHVWRGGSWNCNAWKARSTDRGNYNPDYWVDLIGFRCAMSAESQKNPSS